MRQKWKQVNIPAILREVKEVAVPRASTHSEFKLQGFLERSKDLSIVRRNNLKIKGRPSVVMLLPGKSKFRVGEKDYLVKPNASKKNFLGAPRRGP
jgi:hypothetical protein